MCFRLIVDCCVYKTANVPTLFLDSFSDVSSSSEKAREAVRSDGSSANEKTKQPEKKNIKNDTGKSPSKRGRGRGRGSTRSQDKAAVSTRRRGRSRGRPLKNQTAGNYNKSNGVAYGRPPFCFLPKVVSSKSAWSNNRPTGRMGPADRIFVTREFSYY